MTAPSSAAAVAKPAPSSTASAPHSERPRRASARPLRCWPAHDPEMAAAYTSTAQSCGPSTCAKRPGRVRRRGRAPAPPDVMITSVWSGFGNEPGSGSLPAGLPIQVDLLPRHEATACWADMTRTFLVGEPSPEHAALTAEQEQLGERRPRSGDRVRAPRRHRARSARGGVRPLSKQPGPTCAIRSWTRRTMRRLPMESRPGRPGRSAGLRGRASECARLEDLLSALCRRASRSMVLRGRLVSGRRCCSSTWLFGSGVGADARVRGPSPADRSGRNRVRRTRTRRGDQGPDSAGGSWASER